MSLPWVIGVLSTDYDLHDYRDAIIKELKKQENVEVSAFELPNFPIEPNKHSHDSCLAALKRAKIVILIINKRYGGIYYASSNVSITQREYLSAIKGGIPCLVFVSRRAWDERYAFHSDLKKSGKTKAAFGKEYNCKYVDDVQTIYFIDEILSAYETKQCSNWITCFEGIPDLLTKIKGQLGGLSRFWIKQIVNKQKDKLEIRKTSTSSSMLSLGDVFKKRYYIEPEYQVESGCFSKKHIELENSLVEELCSQKSILIYGEAGYGKTTILAKSFFNHVEKFNKEDGYEIPFYIQLKDKSSTYHFDFYKYIQECFETYLKMKSYPYLDLNISTIIPYFYLDGFDEIAEIISTEEVNRIVKSSIFNYPLLLTSRIQYAIRYLHNYDLANKFNVCIKINKWDSEKAKKYIDNFCKINSKDQKFINRIYALLTDNKDLNEILDNPLLITMLLWIIEANRMDVPETISTRVELFQECFKELARRELSRAKINSANEKDLILIWAYFSWLVYKEKLAGRKAKINNLLIKLQTEYLPQYGKSYNESIFESIFDTSGEFVFGTFHEQFLEFLVAITLNYACFKKKKPYPEFLKYVVRPEINRYFRGIWDESIDSEKEKIANNIFEQYKNNVGLSDNTAIATRVHAIYHISRLNSRLREENLHRAFSIENNISVRLSLYFGAIKMGWLKEEEQFYNLLVENQEYNMANRGYHLAYYSDIPPEGDLPFFDSGEADWSNTLKAFIRHFESDRREQYFLRRIDLITMLQLMEARKSPGPLTKDILEYLEELTFNPVVRNEKDFQQKVENTFKAVKIEFEKHLKIQCTAARGCGQKVGFPKGSERN